METLKNILLIAPPIYDLASFDLWLKPLGLLYIASFLKRAGFNVRLVDAMDRFHPSMVALTPVGKQFGTGKYFSEKVPKPAVLEALKVNRNYSRFGMPQRIFEEELLKGPEPDLVLVTSMMTYWYPGVFEAIRTSKTLFPGAPVLLGGIYAQLCTQHAIQNSGADQVVVSSDPNEILSTLRSFLSISNFKLLTSNFSTWPSPDLSLYPVLPYAPIMTSIGCPYQCTYCASSKLHPDFLQREPRHVYDEIASLHEERGVVDFAFYDDALLIENKRHFLPLMQMIIRSKMDLRFHTPNGLHTRLINDEMADIFKQAHFHTLRLSLETSDPTLQQMTGGKVSNSDFVKAVKALHRVGYHANELRTYVLVGIPGQSLKQVNDTINFVLDCGARPSICEYSLIPGSADWAHLSETMDLESIDPLLHNNSLFGPSMGWIRFEDIEEIKEFIRRKMRLV